MSDATVPSVGPLPAGSSAVSAGEAEAFLVGRFGAGLTDVAPIGGGAWSKAYAFRRDGADYVARFGGYLEDFAKDRLAGRYASADLPVPAVTEIGEALGGFYAISERSFGGFIDHLDGEGMRATLPSLFAALDAARSVDLSATTGYGGWDATGAASYPRWRAALLDVAADPPGGRGSGWRERLEAPSHGSGAVRRGVRPAPRPRRVLSGGASPDPQRSPPFQRPGRWQSHLGGVRLGLRPVRRLPVRPGLVRVLVALVSGLAGYRFSGRGGAPLRGDRSGGSVLRRAAPLLPGPHRPGWAAIPGPCRGLEHLETTARRTLAVASSLDR